MTPDPTPVSGMMPFEVSTLALVVMRTTAGLTAAATSIVAEFSSTVTGTLLAPTVVPVGAGLGHAGRSRLPVARRASTVPPEARTAERSGRGEDGADTAAAPDAAGSRVPVATGAVATAPGTTAGSYQRSGVGAASGSPSWRDQSVRGSGGGE